MLTGLPPLHMGGWGDELARDPSPHLDRADITIVGCQSAAFGQLSRHWRSRQQQTLIAGSIAWVGILAYRRQPPAVFAPQAGLAPGLKALAVLDPGRGVTVTIPRAERSRLALDYTNLTPNTQTSKSGQPLFPVSAGASAVTFKPCPRSSYPDGRTQFAGAFIVSGAQCALIDIRPVGSPTTRPRRIPFGRSC